MLQFPIVETKINSVSRPFHIQSFVAVTIFHLQNHAIVDYIICFASFPSQSFNGEKSCNKLESHYYQLFGNDSNYSKLPSSTYNKLTNGEYIVNLSRNLGGDHDSHFKLTSVGLKNHLVKLDLLCRFSKVR